MSLEMLRQATIREPMGIDPLAELRKLVMQPGLYFGLPAEPYHADPSLGSTDIRGLHKSARGWQWGSWMTEEPRRRRFGQTKATILGTALHKIVLEGSTAFAPIYVRRSDDYEEMSISEKTQFTKALKAKLSPNQIILSAEDYDLCLSATDLITEHQQLRESLTGGENEVSMFWVDAKTGVPCKARFDRLVPMGIGDIKTLANERRRRFETWCRSTFKSERYDLQAAHYLAGRSGLPSLIKQERIHTITGAMLRERMQAQVELCAGIAKSPRNYAFQFVWLCTTMPEVFSETLSPANPLIGDAAAEREHVLATFASNLSLYGARPWPQGWTLGELHREDIPGGEWGWA